MLVEVNIVASFLSRVIFLIWELSWELWKWLRVNNDLVR